MAAWMREKYKLMFALTALLIAAAIPIGGAVYSSGSGDLRKEGAAAIKAAVEKCALQCYVVEGFYPPSLAYLEDNYGLWVNREDYFVVYEIFASNVPPEIQVLDRK